MNPTAGDVLIDGQVEVRAIFERLILGIGAPIIGHDVFS
jgi:hypothetical protein